MLPWLRFETQARIAYVVLVVLLVAGTAFTVRSATALSERQVARVREAEREITLVERLRWNSELIVSDGRGYLVAAEPHLLAGIRASEARFDENVRALRSTTLSTQGAALVTDAQTAAAGFREIQEQLLAARQSGAEPAALVRRFESELLPRRAALDAALDRLVDHKQAALAVAYEDARSERRSAELTLYALLGALALVAVTLAFFFAALLGRAYRRERDALDTARKALATRDDVMGMIAHDLRNPLGAILMKAELFASDKITPEKARRHAESIGNLGRRMDNLIRSMLDLATLESGQFTVTQAPCEVDPLVRDASDVAATLALSKEVRIDTRVETPRLRIAADRERVLQVLSNLFGNAVKFSPPGGTITLSVRREGDTARFAVSDEGPGIPADNLAHLFERYWKRETGGKKGTGLGLFIAKGIVEAHGGSIHATSEPGRGATFAFTIPLDRSEAAAEGHDAANAERVAGDTDLHLTGKTPARGSP